MYAYDWSVDSCVRVGLVSEELWTRTTGQWRVVYVCLPNQLHLQLYVRTCDYCKKKFSKNTLHFFVSNKT